MKKSLMTATALIALGTIAACGGSGTPTEAQTDASPTPAVTEAVTTSFEVEPGNGERCHVASSHYVGWYVAPFVQDQGIADKWGAKYGVDLEFKFVNNYVDSLNQYSGGAFEGVTATTIDTATFPAAGGIASDILIIGDYSNGNDVIIAIDPDGSIKTPADLAGVSVALEEYSISDYLLARFQQMSNQAISEIPRLMTAEGDIAGVAASGGPGTVVATWKPNVTSILDSVPHAKAVFDSSSIPGEILDAVVVRSDASNACKAAITGAWYEGFKIMSGTDQAADEAINFMTDFASGGQEDRDWFMSMVATTQFFYDPADGAAVAYSDELKQATEYVLEFAFDYVVTDLPFKIGVAFPDGTVLGDKENVLITFNADFMEAAANDQL